MEIGFDRESLCLERCWFLKVLLLWITIKRHIIFVTCKADDVMHTGACMLVLESHSHLSLNLWGQLHGKVRRGNRKEMPRMVVAFADVIAPVTLVTAGRRVSTT
jgi:hypothetical protein